MRGCAELETFLRIVMTLSDAPPQVSCRIDQRHNKKYAAKNIEATASVFQEARQNLKDDVPLVKMNIILLLLAAGLASAASYRNMPIDGHNMCTEAFPNKHSQVSIGTGAIIVSLSKPRIAFHPSQDKSKLCEVHINAPDEGMGILAYVEEAYLRKNATDSTCKDYIQFGQDDSVPFFTMRKSDPVCGRIDGRRDVTKGFMYDAPNGKLIVWVNLAGRKKTADWPAIYRVNLTIVVTAYQPNCGTKKTTTAMLKNVQPPKPGFRWCGQDPGPCISKDYFCDRRFNCLLDQSSNTSYDEVSCQYPADIDTAATDAKDTESQEEEDEEELEIVVDPNALNTISWILIAICSFIGVVLVLVLAIGCTRNSFCHKSSPLVCSSGANQHERHLAQLSQNRPETEPNLYLPLETFRQSTTPIQEEQVVLQAEEPPPPSYESLFPDANSNSRPPAE